MDNLIDWLSTPPSRFEAAAMVLAVFLFGQYFHRAGADTYKRIMRKPD